MVKTIKVSDELHQMIREHGIAGDSMQRVLFKVFNELQHYKTKSASLESRCMKLQDMISVLENVEKGL